MTYIFVILLVIALVAYASYQSLPQTKFDKASICIREKKYDEAIMLLEKILNAHHDAPAKYAECRILMSQRNENSKVKELESVLQLRARIELSYVIESFEPFEAQAGLALAQHYFELAEGNVLKLQENLNFIEGLHKNSLELDFENLRRKHLSLISDFHFLAGVRKERKSDYSSAIISFQSALKNADSGKIRSLSDKSSARIMICRLKQGEIVLPQKDVFGLSIDDRLKCDLYYRIVLRLLEKGEYTNAEVFLNDPSTKILEVHEELKSIVLTHRRNTAYETINFLNDQIDKIYNGELTLEELKEFYLSIDDLRMRVEPLDSVAGSKISSMKLTIFNRLLFAYIDNNQFESAISIIGSFDDFWNNPDMLKNLGICSLRLVEKRLLNKKNYKLIISSWLTAVHSDRVILKSIDDTSWDDNYTFTLAESVGSRYSVHKKLPENVNYNPPSEFNISIGATQKELINQFEGLLSTSVDDQELLEMATKFYDQEKADLINVINTIDKDIVFSTPFFAIQHGLNREIIVLLEEDYNTYQNEDALLAGMPFIKESKKSIVYQFSLGHEIIGRVLKAIEKQDFNELAKINTKANMTLINQFKYHVERMEDEIYISLSNQIDRSGGHNRKLINVMEECLKFSIPNEKLKHQYSQFVAAYCISSVNENRITHLDALELMKRAYLSTPNNVRVCKNIITLIRFNLMDILNDRIDEWFLVFNILDKLKNNLSVTYKKNCAELLEARAEILAQLQAAGVDVSLFEHIPFGNNIIRDLSLNEQGRKMKMVLRYFGILGNDPMVRSDMDLF